MKEEVQLTIKQEKFFGLLSSFLTNFREMFIVAGIGTTPDDNFQEMLEEVRKHVSEEDENDDSYFLRMMEFHVKKMGQVFEHDETRFKVINLGTLKDMEGSPIADIIKNLIEQQQQEDDKGF